MPYLYPPILIMYDGYSKAFLDLFNLKLYFFSNYSV
nr:MAG TPA: hypothetical protein [Bacteriophage sp.]